MNVLLLSSISFAVTPKLYLTDVNSEVLVSLLILTKIMLPMFQTVDFKGHILQFSGFVWHESDVSCVVPEF
jgi:hypothetical protein